MSHQPRFEIVRTDAGWHARFRAANGRIVWHTENYQRRRAAASAIEQVTSYPILDGSRVWGGPEVRDVDEHFDAVLAEVRSDYREALDRLTDDGGVA